MNIDKVLTIASSFIINAKSQVLLIQRSEKSSYPGYWQLVEGKMENDESPNETIAREVREEIGVQVTKLELNSVLHNEIEAKGLKYLCFRIVFNTTISSNKIKISNEHVAFGWFNKNDVMKLQLLPGTEKILNKLL
jgi:8-oxo-dGTP diphosphatase